MATLTCITATLLALLTIPLVVIWRISQTRDQRIRYYVQRRGWSQRKTAAHFGISRHAVRCALLA
jgi:hypothetical protein